MYLKQISKGTGGSQMATAIRPQTCQASTSVKQSKQPKQFQSQMEHVIKSNPKQFYPKKISTMNFHSTSYNFVNFSPQKKTEEVIKMKT
jgi:hypothetical protein